MPQPLYTVSTRCPASRPAPRAPLRVEPRGTARAARGRRAPASRVTPSRGRRRRGQAGGPRRARRPRSRLAEQAGTSACSCPTAPPRAPQAPRPRPPGRGGAKGGGAVVGGEPGRSPGPRRPGARPHSKGHRWPGATRSTSPGHSRPAAAARTPRSCRRVPRQPARAGGGAGRAAGRAARTCCQRSPHSRAAAGSSWHGARWSRGGDRSEACRRASRRRRPAARPRSLPAVRSPALRGDIFTAAGKLRGSAHRTAQTMGATPIAQYVRLYGVRMQCVRVSWRGEGGGALSAAVCSLGVSTGSKSHAFPETPQASLRRSASAAWSPDALLRLKCPMP